ncbi:MAG: type I glutamate--ammonia ligase, partial [Thermoproteota archaeon]|nr:type I glutamate--ammonia ligase [Thermoproteota archaeon]
MTIAHDYYSIERKEDILDKQGLLDTEFIQVRYTDVPGRFLAKYVFLQNEDPQDFFRTGIGVDGSSVRGFVSIDESDLLLLPDRSTLRRAPISSYKVATVIADIYWGFGRGRLARDPRYVCQRLEEHLAQEGLVSQVGPEVECFIFDDIVLDKDMPKIVSVEQSWHGKYPIPRKGGYDAPPFEDSLLELRFEIADMLKKNYLIKVTNLNHEVASCGQIEINFMHSTLTKAADNVQIYKDVVRNVSKRHGKVANFMPKPIFDENDPHSTESDNGSGMHTSVSLWTKSESDASSSGGSKNNNIFYDTNDDYTELSQAGRYFVGGILNHVSSLAALVAPTVNSYHRLVPGFEAPVYAAWSKGNRSAIVRVPANYRGNAESKRIEFRAPDPSANPYLAFSAILAAGLDGMKKKMDPGDPVNEDIYKMSDSSRSSRSIKSLPGSLQESLQALKSDSDYLKPYFDADLIESYLSLKQREIS